MPRKARAIKDNGTYIFQDFSEGLYLLDTPRGLGEQLASLALKGGRNVWSEKGALVPQYGYDKQTQIDNDVIVGVTQDAINRSSFFLIGTSGTIYFYTAEQGLKKYKTTFPSISGTPVITRRGNDLIIYNEGQASMFGAFYTGSEAVIIDEDVPCRGYTDTQYIFEIPKSSEDFYWNGKQISVNDNKEFVVTSVQPSTTDEDTIIVRAVAKSRVEITGGIATISEKTLLDFDLTFTYEDSSKGTAEIIPFVMGVCANRLLIADTTGTIFYSQVGVLDSFDETRGAGYFGGFYQDTSLVLSLEDYMSGALITKQNGMYYMTITDKVNVEKVSQIGQEYASDHVIVREKIYAYDSNSGAFVNAVQQNVFGSAVAGRVIVPTEYLDANNQGISEVKRFLTYNGEAEVFILYYGELLEKGLVIVPSEGTLFPRELDRPMKFYLEFNQGVIGVATDGTIMRDFKKGTVIEGVSAIAEFEAIGLKDNRFICSTLLEVTELNGVEYQLTTSNAGPSFQKIRPNTELAADDNLLLPPMIYSNKSKNQIYSSYELTSKWANKQSNVTRIAAPMSGREGVSLSFEFPANQAFCLAAIRLPDFSQGE